MQRCADVLGGCSVCNTATSQGLPGANRARPLPTPWIPLTAESSCLPSRPGASSPSSACCGGTGWAGSPSGGHLPRRLTSSRVGTVARAERRRQPRAALGGWGRWLAGPAGQEWGHRPMLHGWLMRCAASERSACPLTPPGANPCTPAHACRHLHAAGPGAGL